MGVCRSKFFASQLSHPDCTCIESHCSEFDYDDYVNLLSLLYLPVEAILETLGSVKSAIGILQIDVALHCEEITQSCIQCLEVVPCEDKEDEQILKAVTKLVPIAMPILARIQPIDSSATKNVFVTAILFAMSIGGPYPLFGNELKTSALEQVEYMLGEDEETPLVTADHEVKSVVRIGLSEICSSFEKMLSSLLLESELACETTEDTILLPLSDIEWMCNILPKMNLMKDFVSKWLIEITSKVLEAVGYGNVILPAPNRAQLLKTWLPYIRKMKPLLDAKGSEETSFHYKMSEDLYQNIEGAIVSLILVLPSDDQADILVDWMRTEQLQFPDLSEAVEVWCYRTKSAKRRLGQGLDSVNNATASL
ncbi:hypothetical protein I3843_11G113000 [Carya illinoinensis]|nr:hypothetical protein I3843_11G113000 [Carya illinoinensis]